jgi:hydroxyquinol 1,2-dioxygenase
MRNINEYSITQAVLESMLHCKDARLHEVMASLVQHLHDFAREVKLTEQEWHKGIEFLTAAGHITDGNRQEFILLSDVLGLSMLVTAQNNAKPPACTESTVFGPFYVEGAPDFDDGADISNGAKGPPCDVRGTVRDVAGSPVRNALIDVWQADEDGVYDVQDMGAGGHAHRARGRLRSNAQGRFHFRSVLPHSYPIPHDGPVGGMLGALGRHPWRPAHLHFMIQAEGCETLITHVFRDGDPYLDSDAVFGVRSSLISEWVRHESAADGIVDGAAAYSLNYDFVLNPSQVSA